MNCFMLKKKKVGLGLFTSPTLTWSFLYTGILTQRQQEQSEGMTASLQRGIILEPCPAGLLTLALSHRKPTGPL